MVIRTVMAPALPVLIGVKAFSWGSIFASPAIGDWKPGFVAATATLLAKHTIMNLPMPIITMISLLHIGVSLVSTLA